LKVAVCGRCHFLIQGISAMCVTVNMGGLNTWRLKYLLPEIIRAKGCIAKQERRLCGCRRAKQVKE
jgi:hypothetical protein